MRTYNRFSNAILKLTEKTNKLSILEMLLEKQFNHEHFRRSMKTYTFETI